MTSSTLPAALPTPLFSSFPSSRRSGAITCPHPNQNLKLRCSTYILDSKSCIHVSDPMGRPPGWCHPGVRSSCKLIGRLEGKERKSRHIDTSAGSSSYWITVAQAFGVDEFCYSGCGTSISLSVLSSEVQLVVAPMSRRVGQMTVCMAKIMPKC